MIALLLKYTNVTDENLPGPLPVFETIKGIDEIGEFWTARKLSTILGYSDYCNFKEVMKKAWDACKNSGQLGRDHFGKLTTMVNIGSGAQKPVEDVRLSRYACYLIVQNADPSKEVIALGQTYFAVQTRIREIQQMSDYANLDTEEEKRIFLRKEMKELISIWQLLQKERALLIPLIMRFSKISDIRGYMMGLIGKEFRERKDLLKKMIFLITWEAPNWPQTYLSLPKLRIS